jgi:hypothetical protein
MGNGDALKYIHSKYLSRNHTTSWRYEYFLSTLLRCLDRQIQLLFIGHRYTFSSTMNVSKCQRCSSIWCIARETCCLLLGPIWECGAGCRSFSRIARRCFRVADEEKPYTNCSIIMTFPQADSSGFSFTERASLNYEHRLVHQHMLPHSFVGKVRSWNTYT